METYYMVSRPVGHAKEPPFRDSPGGSASEAICSFYEGNELILGPRLKVERPRRSWLDGKVIGRLVYVKPRPVGHPKAPPFATRPEARLRKPLVPL
jgi:hypothetical protein